MTDIDPRLISASTRQLARRSATLAAGARRVGWKLGVGDRERIGTGPVVGHLTSATLLEAGASYVARDARALHADAELAVVMGRDAVTHYGAALELVDLAAPPDDPEAIVEANVFHRAVAFGPVSEHPPAGGLTGALVVNGEVRASAPAGADVVGCIRAVARLLDVLGERLLAGDRVITGAIVQVAVTAGDVVAAELGPLGRVELTVA